MSASELLAVGCYTPDAGGRGEGVTLWRAGDGQLDQVGALALPAPSFVAWHPALPVLYAIEDAEAGAVTAVRVGPGERMSARGRLPTGGSSPCHVGVAPDGRHLLVAHYGDGAVSAVALDPRGDLAGVRSVVHLTGSGPDPQRQEGPHAHMALPRPGPGPGPRPSSAVAVVVDAVDLGGDAVHTLRLGADGSLRPVARVALPAGTGPRHLAVSGGTACVAGELSATVVVLRRRPDGGWRVTGTGPATAGAPAGEGVPAHVQLSGDGRFLYASSRGLDVVSAFAVTPGGLVPVADCPVAAGPRHFRVGDRSAHVTGQAADALEVLDVDPRTGALHRTGLVRATGSPTCVVARP